MASDSHEHGHSGDERTRTADPLLAKQVLYQLSYVPATYAALPAETFRRAATPLAHSAGTAHISSDNGERKGSLMMVRTARSTKPIVGDLAGLVPSFRRHLRAANRSERTAASGWPRP